MIKDEMESAECYAEKYIEAKAMGETSYAEKYKLFAQQEIEHGMFIHSLAADFINKVSKVFEAPVEMREKWNDAHEEYVAKVNEIKSMLSM